MPIASNTLPTLHLDLLRSGDAAESKKLLDACRSHGFFYLDLARAHKQSVLRWKWQSHPPRSHEKLSALCDWRAFYVTKFFKVRWLASHYLSRGLSRGRFCGRCILTSVHIWRKGSANSWKWVVWGLQVCLGQRHVYWYKYEEPRGWDKACCVLWFLFVESYLAIFWYDW